MAAYVKYQDFVEQVLKGGHQFHAAGHTFKVALTNAAPNVATHTGLSDITELSGGSGYSAGGTDVQNDLTETTGTATVSAVDVVFTASGGTIGPFRYVVLYNDTHASDALVAYWDYTSSISLLTGETLTVDFAANSLLTLT